MDKNRKEILLNHLKQATLTESVLQQVKKELDENGYSIVKGMILGTKAVDYRKQLVESIAFLHKEQKLDKEDPKKWKSKDMPFSLHGIFKHYGVGHFPACIGIREEPNIYKTFAYLYQDDDLDVSLDGICYLPPNGRAEENVHTDQAPLAYIKGVKKRDLRCYQGFMSLTHCGPKDGGLVVYEKSHLGHQSFFEEQGKENLTYNWYIYSSTNKKKTCPPAGAEYLAKYKRVKVCCEPGDFVIWDSRLAHTVTPSKSYNYRMVSYVCMFPHKYADEKTIHMKQKAVESHSTTSHWPNLNLTINPPMPPIWNKKHHDNFYHPNDPEWIQRFGISSYSDVYSCLVGLIL